MKKLLITTLILCLSMTMLAGCSKSKDAVSDKKETGTSKNDLAFNPEDYVTLGDYKGLEAYEVDFDATDEEVEDAISDALYENATYTDVTDRGAKEEDYVTFDYSATVDGKEVEDCTDTDYEIQLGNEEFDEAIEKEMVGKKAGETFTVNTEISEDLSTTNAEDKGVFTITMKKIQEETVPTLDLDYVKEYTDYTSVEDYKKGMKENVIESKKSDCNEQLFMDLLQNVVDDSEFKEDYPQELYDDCESMINESIDSSAEMFGMSREDLLANFYGMTEDDVKNEVLNELHSRLVVYAIAKKESLFLTDSQYEKFAEEFSEENGYESVEELEEDYGKELIAYEGIYENVTSFLFDKAEKTSMSEEEYNSMNAEEGETVEDEDETDTDDAVEMEDADDVDAEDEE